MWELFGRQGIASNVFEVLVRAIIYIDSKTLKVGLEAMNMEGFGGQAPIKRA